MLTLVEKILQVIANPVMLFLLIVQKAMWVLKWQMYPYTVIGLFATRKFPEAKKQHKYAILIPARNEEAVIGNLLSSIRQQDYPAELLTVFVVADNCTDRTAAVARENGAVCYERFDNEHRTKGFALQFLFREIERDYGIESFEGYFIFDSDNLLKLDYISRMNEAFDAGEKIITSYRATKNWNEGWLSSTYAMHWLRSIRQYHRARSVLHLATNIQGTGFLFTNEIVKDGWKYTSLTEDRALTADSVAAGYEISYNDAAVFYDEQPTSLKVAFRQRLRWSKGHIQAFGESGGKLFRNIFVDKASVRKPTDKWYSYPWRTIRHRFMSYDTFAQLLPKDLVSIFCFILDSILVYPLTCYLNGFNGFLFDSGRVKWFCPFLSRIFGNCEIKTAPGPKAWAMCIVMVLWWRFLKRIWNYITKMGIGIYVLVTERRRLPKVSPVRLLRYLICWPVFDIIGRWTQYAAVFVKVTWKPIPHNSKVTIENLNR